jgi:hypothetical protein
MNQFRTKMSFFFFYNIREQGAEQGLSREVGNSWTGKDVGKGCKRVNMVQTLCTRVCK